MVGDKPISMSVFGVGKIFCSASDELLSHDVSIEGGETRSDDGKSCVAAIVWVRDYVAR